MRVGATGVGAGGVAVTGAGLAVGAAARAVRGGARETVSAGAVACWGFEDGGSESTMGCREGACTLLEGVAVTPDNGVCGSTDGIKFVTG